MRAKAAVHYEAGKGVELEELEVLPPRQGEVTVKYVASGVCHSDLHHIQGLVPHPTPVVFGHEGAGIIEEVGPGVTTVQVGDHVLTSYIQSCGRCPWCVIGRGNMCDLRELPRHLLLDGTTRFRKGEQEIFQYLRIGTYAERATVPEVAVIPIRKDAPLELCCLISCGVTAGAGAVINRAKVAPGSSVVVYGCGGVGLNAIQAAALMGAAKVIAVDVFDNKLEWSRDFGATHLINAKNEDPVERVKEICGRGGADYAFEAIGSAKTMEAALQSAHRGGTVVVIGVCPAGTRLTIDPQMLLEERIFTGASFGGSRQRVDLPMFVDLFMAGKWKLRELVSREIELEDLNEAYAALERGEVRRQVVRYA